MIARFFSISVLIPICCAVTIAQSGGPISFTTISSDGVSLHGEVYLADAERSAPVLLLFHQGGGDSRGEYGPLVGRLNAEGYHAIAIDQRRGGDRFKGENRTLQGVEGREFSYCDVYPDLVASTVYAREQGFSGKMIAWGSSYSAALVFRLADEFPTEIAGVLAFSPASWEPMIGCEPLPYARKILTPGLVVRPSREMEIERIAVQMAEFGKLGYQTYVADPGVHGSSVLNAERVQGNVEPAWETVLGFLRRVTALSPDERIRLIQIEASHLAWTVGEWIGYREDGADGSRGVMQMTVTRILAESGYHQMLRITHDAGTYNGAAMDVYDPVAGRWVRQYVNGTNGRFVRIHGIVAEGKSIWRSAAPNRSRESFLVSERADDSTWIRTMNIQDQKNAEWRVLWKDVLTRKENAAD